MAIDMINSLQFGNDTHVFTLPYGVCNTAANTADKVVTVDNFPTTLEAGATVIVKFTYDNNIADSTLNVNNTGAKPIYRYGTTAVNTEDSTTGWRGNSIHLFTYDGTGWMRTFWENTTYSNASLGNGYATCDTAAATAAKVATLNNYTLTTDGYVSVRFANAVTVANPTLNINNKGAKKIYFNNAALTDITLIKAGDVVTFVYSTDYHIVAINGSVCTAGSYGPNVNATPMQGESFNVPYITVDKTGRITDISNKTVTIPTGDNTNLAKLTSANNFAASNVFNSTTTFKGNIVLDSMTYGNALPDSSLDPSTAGQLYFIEDDGDNVPKGGIKGQLLIKNSATDGDASWQSIMPASATNKHYVVAWGDEGLDYNASIYTQDNVLFGAAWNDYAEYRAQKENIEPGYCVASSDNGEVYKTTEKFQACDGIVSDTFGFVIGETKKSHTPLAVAGRVLAYCEGNRENYHAGDTVCAGPEGRVHKMTREEIREWPDRIIGIVSEIPTYEVWGQNKVKVNNRIWIKVK